jgi:hypothetical protein
MIPIQRLSLERILERREILIGISFALKHYQSSAGLDTCLEREIGFDGNAMSEWKITAVEALGNC